MFPPGAGWASGGAGGGLLGLDFYQDLLQEGLLVVQVVVLSLQHLALCSFQVLEGLLVVQVVGCFLLLGLDCYQDLLQEGLLLGSDFLLEGLLVDQLFQQGTPSLQEFLTQKHSNTCCSCNRRGPINLG